MEGNLRFKINWPSLIVGSKFTVFLCFALYLMAIFQVQAPGGLVVGGAYFQNLQYLKSLILIQIIPKERTPRIAKLTVIMTSLDSMT